MPLGLMAGWRWRMSKASVQRLSRRFQRDGFEHPVARDHLWWRFKTKSGGSRRMGKRLSGVSSWLRRRRGFTSAVPLPSPTSRHQRGNMILMLFSAVAMAGLLGTGYMTLMKGPGKGLSSVSKQNLADNSMLAATSLVLGPATSQDCDGDGTVEPLPFRADPAAPVGGGLLPAISGANKLDPWGKEYGYCVWDHGKKTTTDNIATCGGTAANRLKGGSTSAEYVLAIISAGPDRVFQTTCNAWLDANADNVADTALIVTAPGSDDRMRPSTMDTLIASGTAQLQTQPDAACVPGSEGITRFDVGVMQVCTPAGWKEVGASVSATAAFTDVPTATVGSPQTSNQISFSGFFGTKTATVGNGAVILVNGVDKGTGALVVAGDLVSLRATASGTSLTTTTYTLKIGAIARPWSITTLPASCTLDGQTVAHGAAWTFFPVSSVACGSTCSGQIRVCTNGVLDGLAVNNRAACTVAACASCTLDGQVVAHGAAYTFFSATSSSNCALGSLSRTCANGALNGSASYQYAACSAPACTPQPWTSRASAADIQWQDITYGNGLFVAVSYYYPFPLGGGV